MRFKNLFAAAAAIAAVPFMTMAAQAATCGVIAVNGAGNELTSTGCSNGPVTFSNIDIKLSLAGSAFGTLTSLDILDPFVGPNGHTEYGLQLIFTSGAGGTGGIADVAWTYNVSATYLTDAYLGLVGTAANGGSIGVTETITAPGIGPGGQGFVVLSLTGAGNTDLIFNPEYTVFAQKDEFAQAFGGEAFANTSILTNAFSVTTVTPLPAAVWMFGSVLAGAGGVASWRRKRKAA